MPNFVLFCAIVFFLLGLGQGQECLSSFPGRENVTQPSSNLTQGQNASPQLRIFPAMTINCSGVITNIVVSGEFGTKQTPYPEIQIWRPVPEVGNMTYTTTPAQMVSIPLGCGFLSKSKSSVIKCSLVVPISVEVGDIVGILLQRNLDNETGYLIYFTETYTPSYDVPLSNTSFTIPPESTEPDYDMQPLLYLDIQTEPGAMTTAGPSPTQPSTVTPSDPTRTTGTTEPGAMTTAGPSPTQPSTVTPSDPTGTTGQECLSGFPQRENVTQPSSHITQSLNASTQLLIFPTMTINCNGTVTSIVVSGKVGSNQISYPEIQIWRPIDIGLPELGNMKYTTTPTRMVSLPFGCSALSNLSVYTIQCTLSVPISVEVGDFIGILLPRNLDNEGYLIYFTETYTPSYELPLSNEFFTILQKSTEPDYDMQPLLYLDIQTGPTTAETPPTGPIVTVVTSTSPFDQTRTTGIEQLSSGIIAVIAIGSIICILLLVFVTVVVIVIMVIGWNIKRTAIVKVKQSSFEVPTVMSPTPLRNRAHNMGDMSPSRLENHSYDYPYYKETRPLPVIPQKPQSLVDNEIYDTPYPVTDSDNEVSFISPYYITTDTLDVNGITNSTEDSIVYSMTNSMAIDNNDIANSIEHNDITNDMEDNGITNSMEDNDITNSMEDNAAYGIIASNDNVMSNVGVCKHAIVNSTSDIDDVLIHTNIAYSSVDDVQLKSQ